MKAGGRPFSGPMPGPWVNLPACAGPGPAPWVPNQDRLSGRVHRLGRRLKSLGVPITISGIRDALHSLIYVDVSQKADFEIALRANLICRKEDLGLFESEFEHFWRSLEIMEEQETGENSGAKHGLGPADPGSGEEEFHGGEEKAGGLFSRAEALAEKDFQLWKEDDWQEFSRWAQRWVRPLINRCSLRFRSSPRGSRLEIRKTLRRNLRVGGDLSALVFRRKKNKPRRLIFLADVSGSMEPYGRSFFLFLQSWLKAFFPVEIFAFSTRLTYLSPLIKSKKMEELKEVVSNHVPQWSSGTRIGESLEQFLRVYGQRFLGSRSLVLIFSDGWDLGEPEVLREALRRIRRRTHRILWLNPLMGCPDYQPICQGMATALPWVDRLLPVYDLKTLYELGEAVEKEMFPRIKAG
jgi:uncharacterized protein with von Willebrand factor type A (vWA) domain